MSRPDRSAALTSRWWAGWLGLVMLSWVVWLLARQWPPLDEAEATAPALARCEQLANEALAAPALALARSLPSALAAWLAALMDAGTAATAAARLAQAWQQTAAVLAASPQARQQAAGLLMAQPWPPGPAGLENLPADALGPLVALALRSGDATVLSWALGACAAAQGAPACQGLSARQLLRAAPGNLVSWLWLLSQEPAALDEALHGMASAETVDLAWLRWAATVASAVPAGLAPSLRLQLVNELIYREPAGVWPSFQPMLKACSEAALADANRQQRCQAIAQRLVDQSRELFTQRLGIALGQRLGWPAERLAALRAVGDPPRSPLPLWQAPGLVPQCALRMQQDGLAAIVQSGELAWLRQQRGLPAGR